MTGFAQLLGSMISESGDAFVLTPVEYMIGSPLLPALHGGAVASFAVHEPIRVGGSADRHIL